MQNIFKMEFNDNSSEISSCDAFSSPKKRMRKVDSSTTYSPDNYSKHPNCTLYPHQYYRYYGLGRCHSSSLAAGRRDPRPITTKPPTNEISQSVRNAFIPPHHKFINTVSPDRKSKPDITFGLQEHDIVCGRGAPSNAQHGNTLFKELVKENQTAYICARKADKPKIAIKVMTEVHDRGGRFVRRVKTASDGRGFGWEEIEEKRAYEKICQALRDGAPELRRKMLASEARVRQNDNRDNEENSCVSDQLDCSTAYFV
jgi:hypothetical protein